MNEVTSQSVIEVLQSKRPTSLKALFQAMGGKGKPSQSARAKITAAMPNVIEELNRIKAQVAEQSKAGQTQTGDVAPAADQTATAPKAPKARKAKVARKAPKAKAKARKAKVEVQAKSRKLKEFVPAEGQTYTRAASLYGVVEFHLKANPGQTADEIVAALRWTGKSKANILTAVNVVVRSALDAKSRKAIGMRSTKRHACTKDGYTTSATLNGEGEPVYRFN